MTKWEALEKWLQAHEAQYFNSRWLASSLDVSGQAASRTIQAYLREQRRPQSKSLYVLKRSGRTSNAIWSVGERVSDARMIGVTLFEDVKVKAKQAFAPDLQHLAARNPRAAKYVSQRIDSVLDEALLALKAAIDGE